jgi:hypothetical protein
MQMEVLAPGTAPVVKRASIWLFIVVLLVNGSPPLNHPSSAGEGDYRPGSRRHRKY